MFLQKVSLKYHRSIINYPFGEFMSRKAGVKVEPKNSPKRWALYAHGVGNQCPAHGLSMPSTWSLSAHVTGIKRPCPWTLFN